jgi:hypothetical protein
MKLIPHIIIDRCVYAKNDNKKDVSRNPTQRKAIPKWSYWQVTVSSLGNISVAIIDESQRSHKQRENNPASVCNVTVWI